MTKPPAMPELLTDTDVARIFRRVYGGTQFDSTERMFAAEIEAAVRERIAALQSAQLAATTTVGAPTGMLRTTCPYCENGFAFEQPAAAVSDAEIRHDANLPFVEDEHGAEWVTLSPAMFARAVRRVLALRPAQPAQAGEREAFEAEMRCEETWGHRSLTKRPDGRYQNWQVDLMWDVWQARASLPTQPAAQATPEPVTLGPLAKRNIFDAIRGAYDLGYNDARNARTVPGDSAPGYDGRIVEEDHGSALFNLLSKRLNPATPEPVGEPDTVPLDALHAAERERDYWKTRARAMLDHAEGTCWYWMGDGEDHLESLVNSLPVVIRADQLRELLTHPAPGVPMTDEQRDDLAATITTLSAAESRKQMVLRAIDWAEAHHGIAAQQGAEHG